LINPCHVARNGQAAARTIVINWIRSQPTF
jgi:hypothetical protein